MDAMDTTIRNLDEALYRRLKARAALEGKTVGEAMNEAMRRYLGAAGTGGAPVSLRDLKPEPYGQGNERLSEDVDSVLYDATPAPDDSPPEDGG